MLRNSKIEITINSKILEVAATEHRRAVGKHYKHQSNWEISDSYGNNKISKYKKEEKY